VAGIVEIGFLVDQFPFLAKSIELRKRSEFEAFVTVIGVAGIHLDIVHGRVSDGAGFRIEPDNSAFSLGDGGVMADISAIKDDPLMATTRAAGDATVFQDRVRFYVRATGIGAFEIVDDHFYLNPT
jgi:hypothetical protein